VPAPPVRLILPDRNAATGDRVNDFSLHVFSRGRMSKSASDAAAKPTSRTPMIAAPIAAIVIYAICVTLLLIVFSRALGGLSSNTFGGAALLWAIYLLPAIVAPAAAALFNALFMGERGRRAAFWPNLALILVFTTVAVAWLAIAGGTWNYVLAAVQLASGLAAWFLLTKTARGHADRAAPKARAAPPAPPPPEPKQLGPPG
jgi:hypothetical protein